MRAKKANFDLFWQIGMVMLLVFLCFCCKQPEQSKGEKSTLNLHWSGVCDSLLHDTMHKDFVIDSLKRKILGATNDTIAINWMNELATHWKNRPNLILAEEGERQSKSINYLYGETDALFRMGHYYYWIDEYELADSCLHKAISISEKKGFAKIKIEALIVLGKCSRIQGDFISALDDFQKALHLASNRSDKSQAAFCLNCIGEVYRLKNDNSEALYYFQQSLKVAQQSGDKSRIAYSLSSIGDIYRILDNYSLALENFQEAISLSRQAGDRNLTAFCLNNLGEVYRSRGEIPQALKYLGESIELARELGDKVRLASCLSAVASAYERTGNNDKALEFFQQTLQMSENLGDRSKIAFCKNGMGYIYFLKRDFVKAAQLYNQALKIAKEIEDKVIATEAMNNLGNLHLYLNEVKQAEGCADSCFAMAKDCDTPFLLGNASELCYKVYEKKGNFNKAYQMQKLYLEMKDSLINQENLKKFAAQEFKVREVAMKSEQLKKDLAYESNEREKEGEIHQQKVLRNGLLTGAVLLCGLVFFVYRNLKQSRKAQRIIAVQKKQVEAQKAISEEQKRLVEEKQKEMVDSIHYATQIQQTLFAQDEVLKKHLHDYFVLFRPKDIISGDFYWATEKEGRFYLAVCDSTGHGVPGAFMSLLNISFLNEAVADGRIILPNEILGRVRERLIQHISHSGNQDGMDGVLFCMSDNKVSYSSAYNAPILIRNGKIIELGADKMPIGKWERIAPFSLFNLELHSGDVIYLFTDGFADQFGGSHGKKFKYKALLELLLSVNHLEMPEQKSVLERHFNEWKSDYPQVDDVTLIGFRV